MAQAQRFLVRMKPGSGPASLPLAGASVQFRVEPLFASIGPAGALGLASGATWHVLEPAFAIDATHPWDVCHAIVQQGLGLAGGASPEFAEPDFAQQWLTGATPEQLQALTESCAAVGQKTGPDGFPGAPDDAWYRDPQHAQFGLIAQKTGLPGDGVRIAHLDTGYDPAHASTPARLDKALQRNFVDDDRPHDAADDTAGLFNNRGHGTGTLSLLAGSSVPGVDIPGGAPFASVVPVRVANRVELFYNSAVAKAFDYVHGLCRTPATAVDVVSMSMGGLASQAWAEAVNALYDAGVVVVTAAGNNFANLPTRHIVFPARFGRVVAACGVMADQAPYADLPAGKMAGNYGPRGKMATAMAAYTPNVPWAKFGCAGTMDFDGSGTSAATPQVAAAAAIWIQQNRDALRRLPADWMRAEAARQALFTSTGRTTIDEKLGNGPLRAADALSRPVPAPAQLERMPEDAATFSFLRVLTGFGIEAVSGARQKMLELEALQLSQGAEIEQLLADPEELSALTQADRQAIATALAQHPRASQALKQALAPLVRPSQAPTAAAPPPPAGFAQLHLRHALAPQQPQPASRRLRIYAYDPSLGGALDTFGLNETACSVHWEPELQPGPIGEYVEVIDVDPASGCCHAPVDLNDARLLATDGLRPSEANPQFHQQMVYAVAMKTIDYFERALGRVALWSPRYELSQRPLPGGAFRQQERFVQRLRIYPHALRAQNAYYSPEKKALLLGYFAGEQASDGVPSEIVFTALSSDIVAHETTHALLDGLHRRFREPTNPDVLAFHEAFADIVALFQHFSMEGSLRDQIARSHGDLSQETLLSQLAVQFGHATAHYGALRDAIGTMTKDEQTGAPTWKPRIAAPTDYQASQEPHERGSVLVAAVFDAFLQIYRQRALEPIRLATGGSEVLRPGALSTELADALTGVAAKVARSVLLMCIRALDYCPPVDITFGDFLRAVVTADRDLIPDDPAGYRVAIASAFRARGIYPENIRTVSVDTLTWEPPPTPFDTLAGLLPTLNLRWDMRTRRRDAWQSSKENALKFHAWLMDSALVSDDELSTLGLCRTAQSRVALATSDGSTVTVDRRGIEVHSVRPVRRVGPDGELLSQLVVEVTQSLHTVDGSGLVYRGGSTLIVDLTRQAVSYLVRKRFDQPARIARQQAMWASYQAQVANSYGGPVGALAEPFALLHRPH